MKKTTMLAGLALVSMLIAAPGLLTAQQHQHADSMHGRGMMHGSMAKMNMGKLNGSEMIMGMMGMSAAVMRLQPNQVLNEADSLGLTEDQASSIQEIATAQWDAYQEHMNSMPGHSDELNKLLGDESVSNAEIREWVDGAVGDYREMHTRMIEDALNVREILSQQQIETALDLPFSPTMMMHRSNRMSHHGGR